MSCTGQGSCRGCRHRRSDNGNDNVSEGSALCACLVPSSHCVGCVKSFVTEHQDVAHILFRLHNSGNAWADGRCGGPLRRTVRSENLRSGAKTFAFFFAQNHVLTPITCTMTLTTWRANLPSREVGHPDPRVPHSLNAPMNLRTPWRKKWRASSRPSPLPTEESGPPQHGGGLSRPTSCQLTNKLRARVCE